MNEFGSVADLAQNLFQLSLHCIPEDTGREKDNSPFADMMLREFECSFFKAGHGAVVYRPDHFVGYLSVFDFTENKSCLFGPVLLIHVSDFGKSGFAERYPVRSSQRAAFFAFLEKLPVYTSDELISIAVYLYEQINGTPLSPGDVQIATHNWQMGKSKRLIREDLHSDIANEDYEEMRQTQQIVWHCIREGDPEQLVQEIKNRKMSFHLGLVADPVNNYKVTATIAMTLAMQAAIEGGLDYAIALHTLDLFMLYLERLARVQDIMNLTAAAQLEFAQKVEALRLPADMPPVLTKVIHYIHHHQREVLTAERIAAETHTSQTYISKLFVKHTGMPMAKYIRMLKIREAQRLLKQTDATICAISYQLGFSSQSQFQKVFKRCTGITPNQYRREEALRKPDPIAGSNSGLRALSGIIY